MKRTRKKVILLIAMVLLSVTFPLTSFARNPLNEGRINWIDYTRIRTGYGSNMPVTITVCGIPFYGVVTNGGRVIDDNEVDQIIRQTMMNLGIDENTIAQGEYALWQQSQLQDPINWRNAIAVSKKILTGLAPGGLQDAATAMSAAIGEESLSEAAHEAIVNHSCSSSIIGMGMGGVPGWVAGALASSSDEALKIISEKIRNSDIEQRAGTYTALLDNFYYHVNRIIQQREFESSEDIGKLIFNSTKIVDATVFNVPVKQIWQVDIDAFQNREHEYMGLGGYYRGSIKITISHDLSNLTDSFKPAVLLGKGSPYLKVPQGGSHNIVNKPIGPQHMTKTLTCDDIEFVIPPEGGSPDTIIIDKRFIEENNMSIIHKVVITSNVGVKTDKNTAKYDLGVLSGNNGTTNYVYHTMRNINGRMYPALKNNSSRLLADSTEHITGKTYLGADISNGPTEPFVVDDQVYNRLKNNTIVFERGKVVKNVSK